jgi:hypothetical protein
MSEANAGSQWERVAAELRACREAQQRAWGDIDNTTLGRYLAGEVTPEEQRQIESALDTLPELRKLTDLVRDVLGEVETPEPVSVPYGPTVLPFPQPQAQPRAAAAGTALERRGPARGWKTWYRRRHVRQYTGLAAAACVLFVLGVALPRSSGIASAPESGPSLAYSSPVAARGLPFVNDREALGHITAGEWLQSGGNADDRLRRPDQTLERIDLSVHALEAKGKTREAERLVHLYASNLTRQAVVFQEKGDLDAAEPALHQACRLWTQALGAEAPESVRTRNSLAGMYEVALNTMPAAPNAFALTYAAATPPAPAVSQRYEPTQGMFLTAGQPNFKSYNTDNPYHATPPGQTVHSASGYAPASPYSRPSRHSAVAAKVDSRSVAVAHAKNAGRSAAPSSPSAAVLALRERLTRQNQKELRTTVVPVLVHALRETKDATERQRLERALGQLGPAARDAVPVLLDCYRQATDASERGIVLLTLGQVGSAARQAMPVLVESLHSDNLELRDCAARALAQLGPVARDYGKDLAKVGKDDPLIDHVVRFIDSPAGRSGIEDDAECFSLHTIQVARDEVQRLAATAHFEVHIATVADQAAFRIKKEHLDRQASDKGVYLCIDRQAADVHVYVSDALQKQGLREAQLRDVVKKYLRQKQFDRGLSAGLQVLADFQKQQVKQ